MPNAFTTDPGLKSSNNATRDVLSLTGEVCSATVE